jgi:dihydrofolate synthase/folylpolyglutamate synthase
LPAHSSLPTTLAGWLEYIEALHPKSIAMGLDRVNEVKKRMQLSPGFPIITVGGTNGKGSTCAMLERIYHQAGYKVGCYTSPHFLRYNERVRVACLEASDDALVQAFVAVEAARQDTPLTYFEFGTLAAVWHFMQSRIDVVILEVGLGGRLDAVNAFDPACTIVTAVDFDHMEFLGDNRESIGFEKAGIFRAGVPAICGDSDPPQSLVNHAKTIRAQLRQIGREFVIGQGQEGWFYKAGEVVLQDLPMPALTGSFQLENAACVIDAVQMMQARLPVSRGDVVMALSAVRLPGRFQQLGDAPQVILDVAHNPHAAHALAENLQRLPQSNRTLAVFGMLADKDIAGVIQEVGAGVDTWYLADLPAPRGATAQQLARLIHQYDSNCDVRKFADVSTAYRQACLDAERNDRIVVFGSFYTVADVMKAQPSSK